MKSIGLTIALACVAGLADAGPWPREKGQLFMAAGGNFLLSDGAQLPVHYDPTLYAEWGLTDQITLGVDLHTADKGRIATAFAFASIPLPHLDHPHQVSVSIGYGIRARDRIASETLLRGGLSWGRSLAEGWLAIDGSATFGTIDTTWRPKMDATWGHNWSDRWTTTVQLQTGQGWTNDYYAKISPTAIYTFRPDIKIAVGAVKGLTGDRGAALKLESWLEF